MIADRCWRVGHGFARHRTLTKRVRYLTDLNSVNIPTATPGFFLCLPSCHEIESNRSRRLSIAITMANSENEDYEETNNVEENGTAVPGAPTPLSALEVSKRTCLSLMRRFVEWDDLLIRNVNSTGSWRYYKTRHSAHHSRGLLYCRIGRVHSPEGA